MACYTSIQTAMGLSDKAIKTCTQSVTSFIDDEFTCTRNMRQTLTIARLSPQNMVRAAGQDKLMWIENLKQLWGPHIHPKVAGTAWKLANHCAATDDMIQVK